MATVSVIGGTPGYQVAWNTTPVQNTMTAVNLSAGNYIVTVTDSKGCTETASANITQPPVGVTCDGSQFVSATPGTWGASPNGQNEAWWLLNQFHVVFPSGITVGDCNRFIKLTDASRVRLFLPSGGTPQRLPNGTMVNPTSSSYGNNLAAESIALKLNVYFDLTFPSFAPNSSFNFKDLIISSGTFNGWTVQQLLAEAEHALGCGAPKPYLKDLNTTIVMVNKSWQGGVIRNNILRCPSVISTKFYTEDIDVSSLQHSVYPNPTSNKSSLEWVTTESGFYTIYLYNITGTKVTTLFEGPTVKNTAMKLDISTSELEDGIYFYTIIGKNLRETGKFVVQK